jgi:molybdenum cofactor cytidylyltransferase
VIAGLLLAAGGATRFGSQKLLAPLADGIPLVRQTAITLRGGVDALLVVVGHEADDVSRLLNGVDAVIVRNDAWAEGLSTSVRAGVRALPRAADAAIVALADQPFVDPALIHAIVEQWRATGAPIVSARYAGTRGHPVLFDRAIFAELLQVTGDAGARGVIEREPARVAYVDVNAPMPADVDTPADLARLDRDRARAAGSNRT